MRTLRVLTHVKKLDDAPDDFIVRVTCPCGASRHIEPQAFERIAGRSVTLAALAQRMRCSQCGKKVAELVAVSMPGSPRSGAALRAIAPQHCTAFSHSLDPNRTLRPLHRGRSELKQRTFLAS
jgi:hypothetical protein